MNNIEFINYVNTNFVDTYKAHLQQYVPYPHIMFKSIEHNVFISIPVYPDQVISEQAKDEILNSVNNYFSNLITTN
jgi:hypothetical protein